MWWESFSARKTLAEKDISTSKFQVSKQSQQTFINSLIKHASESSHLSGTLRSIHSNTSCSRRFLKRNLFYVQACKVRGLLQVAAWDSMTMRDQATAKAENHSAVCHIQRTFVRADQEIMRRSTDPSSENLTALLVAHIQLVWRGTVTPPKTTWVRCICCEARQDTYTENVQ